MSIYSKLLEEIKELLIQTPIDIYSEEHEVSLTNNRFELVEEREVKLDDISFKTKKIGLANLTWAQQHILNVYTENFNSDDPEATRQSCEVIWEAITEDLENKRIIRTFPEIKREESIKLVVSNKDE